MGSEAGGGREHARARRGRVRRTGAKRTIARGARGSRTPSGPAAGEPHSSWHPPCCSPPSGSWLDDSLRAPVAGPQTWMNLRRTSPSFLFVFVFLRESPLNSLCPTNQGRCKARGVCGANVRRTPRERRGRVGRACRPRHLPQRRGHAGAAAAQGRCQDDDKDGRRRLL